MLQILQVMVAVVIGNLEINSGCRYISKGKKDPVKKDPVVFGVFVWLALNLPADGFACKKWNHTT